MQATPQKIYRLKSLASLFLVMIPLSRLSWVMYWSDSEMWAVTIARGLFTQFKESAFELKFLFYFPLYLSFEAAQLLELWPMQTARALFFLVACLIVILVFQISRLGHKSKSQLPFLTILTMGSSALFLERIYNVRSDILVSCLILFSLYLVRKAEDTDSLAKPSWRAFTPAVLALFVSLNALFFLPFLILAIPWPSWKEILRESKTKYFLFALGLLALTGLTTSFRLSFDFFTQSLSEAGTAISYFDPKRFEHVFRWAQKDPHLVLLIVAKIIYDLWDYLKTSSMPASPSKLRAIGYWALALIVLHPNRLPFFLVSLLPFLLLWAFELPRFYRYLEAKFEVHPLPPRMLFLIALCAFVSRSSLHGETLMRTHNNEEQIKTMSLLDSLIPRDTHLRIWDPVGILPFHKTFLWYLGPGQVQENEKVAEFFKRIKPEILFETQRFAWVRHLVSEELLEYMPVAKGVYLRNASVPLREASSLNRNQVFSAIQNSFGNLVTRDWAFELMAEDGQGKTRSIEYRDIEGNRARVPALLRLDQLLYIEALQFEEGSEQLKILPTPTASWLEISPLPLLFRFDAAL